MEKFKDLLEKKNAMSNEIKLAMSNEFKLYTLNDLEKILSVTRRTLQTYMQTGRLKGVKIGGKWKITHENLKRFVNG